MLNLYSMNLSNKKNEYFEEMARIFKLLGSPVKLKLLNYISFCPRTVEECAKKFDQSVQNISLHLIALAKAGILEVEQIKNYRYYSLSSNRVVQVVGEALLADPQTLLPEELIWKKSQDELISGVKKNKIILVDLREMEEASYLPVGHSFHYEGRVSLLEDFLKSLPKIDELVFFCRGRMCERLTQAVMTAKEARFNAKGLCLPAHKLKELGQQLN
jgi:DNA-binding transcriptional ArsR family regulator